MNSDEVGALVMLGVAILSLLSVPVAILIKDRKVAKNK